MAMSKLFEADTGRARVCRQQGKTKSSRDQMSLEPNGHVRRPYNSLRSLQEIR